MNDCAPRLDRDHPPAWLTTSAPDPGLQLETIVTNAPIILFELDHDGRYVVSKGKALELIGIRPGEAVGQSIFERYAHVPEIGAATRAALAGEEVCHVVELSGRVFSITYTPKKDRSGTVQRVIGLAYDITDLHRKSEALAASEARLRASEARFRSLVTNMRDIIFCHGVRGQGAYGYDALGPAIYGARKTRSRGSCVGAC